MTPHDCRILLGLRQRELAELLGTTIRTVQYWESGKCPDPILFLLNLLAKLKGMGILNQLDLPPLLEEDK